MSRSHAKRPERRASQRMPARRSKDWPGRRPKGVRVVAFAEACRLDFDAGNGCFFDMVYRDAVARLGQVDRSGLPAARVRALQAVRRVLVQRGGLDAPVKPRGWPYVVTAMDAPYDVALWFGKGPTSYEALAKLNPEVSAGHWAGWRVGREIALPFSWRDPAKRPRPYRFECRVDPGGSQEFDFVPSQAVMITGIEMERRGVGTEMLMVTEWTVAQWVMLAAPLPLWLWSVSGGGRLREEIIKKGMRVRFVVKNTGNVDVWCVLRVEVRALGAYRLRGKALEKYKKAIRKGRLLAPWNKEEGA